MKSTTPEPEPEPPVTFRSLYEELGIPGDAKRSAGLIAERLGVTGEALSVLEPLIVEECEHIDRSRVRKVERAGWKSTDAAAKTALLSETFALGDGRRVRWDEATVVEHQMHIEMLRKMRDGIDVTINLHLAAIDDITKAGVQCLADLQVAA